MTNAYLDVISLIERLHRHFLEVVKLELEGLGIHDINNVQGMMLFNIGDSEMTASELLWRGCYLGSNVSYNLKKLTETGYVIQERSQHDRRVIMVRNSEKGMALCGLLKEMNDRHIAALSQANCKEEDLMTCRKMLRTLHHFWSRAAEMKPALTVVAAADQDRAAPAGPPGLARYQAA